MRLRQLTATLFTAAALAAVGPAAAAVAASSIPPLAVAGVDVEQHSAVDTLRRLFAGTGMNVYVDPTVGDPPITFSSGPDTLDRVAARIARAARLQVDIVAGGIRLSPLPPRVAGYDPGPCLSDHKTDFVAGRTELYGLPLGEDSKPINTTCVPTGEIVAHQKRVVARRDDEARNASIEDEITEISIRGVATPLGEVHKVLRPWALVHRSIEPSEADAFYRGCIKQIPMAVRDTWRRADGQDVTLTGTLTADFVQVRDCPLSPLQQTISEQRDRYDRHVSCDQKSGRAAYTERQILEMRDVQVMVDGQRRPGRWRRIAAIDSEPPGQPPSDITCSPQSNPSTAMLGN